MMSNPKTPILLIRHGETPWNVAGRWQGHADTELTVEGRAQAREVAEALASEVHRPWKRIIASDLTRARETAAALADALALSVEVDPRLRELDVGGWSGLTRAEIEGQDRARLLAFEGGDLAARPGGGESRIELRERAVECVRDWAARRAGEPVIAVTHLGVIRALAPGAEPSNAARVEIIAEELVTRPVGGATRREEGAL